MRSDRKLVQIDSREIRYIESLKNYLAFHTSSQKIVAHATLSTIEAELRSNLHFVQVHKSFIVTTRFVAQVGNGLIVLKDSTELPIGGNYRDGLLQAIRILNT